jgi:hypothetical protein
MTINDSQVGTIVPNGIGKISAKGINQDLVFVEFQHDVREPPVTSALHALAIRGRSAWWRTGIKGLLDDVRDANAWGEREATP